MTLIQEKKLKTLLQEKKNTLKGLTEEKTFERPCRAREEIFYGRGLWKKKNSFQKFPPPPRSLLVVPLVIILPGLWHHELWLCI